MMRFTGNAPPLFEHHGGRGNRLKKPRPQTTNHYTTMTDLEKIFEEMDALGIPPMTEEQAAEYAYKYGEAEINRECRHYVGMDTWYLSLWSYNGKHYVTDEHSGYIQFCGTYETEEEALAHYLQSEQHALTD